MSNLLKSAFTNLLFFYVYNKQVKSEKEFLFEKECYYNESYNYLYYTNQKNIIINNYDKIKENQYYLNSKYKKEKNIKTIKKNKQLYL